MSLDGNPVSLLRAVVTASVADDLPDLSLRQLAVVLVVYTRDAPQTVRGLAAYLNVSKAAISRALDRLEELGYAERVDDPRDARSRYVIGTKTGQAVFQQLRERAAAAPPADACPV